MVDPLSITTGVIALLGTCISVGVQLKSFRDGVETANATVNGLLSDVEGLENVLESMSNTFNQPLNQPAANATGHIGNHWKNMAKSLDNARVTLGELQELLEGVNKQTAILDFSRKHLRLKAASPQIATFRSQIQSYRDALQLSMQSIIL